MNREILRAIAKDPIYRKALAIRSFYYFFHIYFWPHIQFETADFQKEMIDIAQDFGKKFTVITAFRGSGKSTIISQAYVIWSILGIQNLKYIAIVSQTQSQSRQILKNIRTDLETNELLRRDFGPFGEPEDDWKANSLILPARYAAIRAFSISESIRGTKHNQHRPQLMIFDDIEDNDSVRTKEARDKTYEFITSQAIPAGDINTKYMVVGNLLHYDSVIMRFIKEIETGVRNGIFRTFPLLDKNGKPLWPDKFQTKESIDQLKKLVGNDKVFRQEYLQEIVADEDQIIHREWISYYDEIPQVEGNRFRFIAIGVDLAISEKDSADYTAFVCAYVFGTEENLKIYILPYPVNKRINFSETNNAIENVVEGLGGKDKVKIFIESVGYQQAFVEVLQNKDYDAYAVPVNTYSKKERLSFIADMVRYGKVLFPRTGAEDLIDQLVNFGVEKYDDLADAFSILIKKIRENSNDEDSVLMIKCDIYKNTFSSLYGNSGRDWADEDDDEIFSTLSLPKRYR